MVFKGTGAGAPTAVREASGNGGGVTAAVSAPTTGAGSIVIDLSAPLPTHTGDVRKLTLRQPKFADYIEIGDIDLVVAKGVQEDGQQPEGMEVKTDYHALMRWATRLTDLDRIVLGNLAPGDAGNLMRAVRMAVAPFQRGNSPSAPTSSSSSSA